MKKRQDPGQVNKDLIEMNRVGFGVVAMTIIGLPYDTEETIMEFADWVTGISKYQTANFLTPLPATSNWDDLTPLSVDGGILQEGEVRPYHLYTGRQLVHYDERWTMQESRELFDKFSAKLTSVDDLYRRVFRMLRTYRLRLAATSRELGDTITARITEATEALRSWADPVSVTGKEFSDNLSLRVGELVETLRAVSQPLANARREVAETVGVRVNELADSLKILSDPPASGGKELAANISRRITELTDMLNRVLMDTPRKGTLRE